MFSGTGTLIIIEPIDPAGVAPVGPVERFRLSESQGPDCVLAANTDLFLLDRGTRSVFVFERGYGSMKRLALGDLRPIAIASLRVEGMLLLCRRGDSVVCARVGIDGATLGERRIETEISDPAAIAPLGEDGCIVADRRGHRLLEVRGEEERIWSSRASYRELLAIASRCDDAGREALISRGLLEYPQWLAGSTAGTVLADRDKLICRLGDSLAILKQPMASLFGHPTMLGNDVFLLGDDATLLRINLGRSETALFRLQYDAIALAAMPPDRLALLTRRELLFIVPPA